MTDVEKLAAVLEVKDHNNELSPDYIKAAYDLLFLADILGLHHNLIMAKVAEVHKSIRTDNLEDMGFEYIERL